MATKKTKDEQAEKKPPTPEEFFNGVCRAMHVADDELRKKADGFYVDFLCVAYRLTGFCDAIRIAESAPKRSEAFKALKKVAWKSSQNLAKWADAVNAKRKTKEAKGV